MPRTPKIEKPESRGKLVTTIPLYIRNISVNSTIDYNFTAKLMVINSKLRLDKHTEHRNGISLLAVCLLLFSGVFFFQCKQSHADPIFEGNNYVKAKLASDVIQIQPHTQGNSYSTNGRSARIGVLLEIDPGWHIYWENSGEAGLPTTITWELPDYWHISKNHYPSPKKFSEVGDIETYGYENRVLIWTELYDPQERFNGTRKISISASIKFLACNNKCLPGQLKVSNSFNFSAEGELAPSPEFNLFQEAEMSSPMDISKARLLFDFPDLDKLVVPHFIQNQNSYELRFGFPTNTDNIRRFISSIQIMPKSYPGVVWGRSAPHPDLPNNPQVSLSLEIDKNKIDTHHGNLSGIIAIPPEITGLNHTLAIDWQYNLRLMSNSSHATTSYSLALALLGAIVAGFLLNLMPCVLPVISLKIFSLVELREKNSSDVKLAVVFYTAGICLTFSVLALLVILLQSAGSQIGWGFQFQSPYFLALLALLVFLLAFSFFGFYSLQLPGLNFFVQQTSSISSASQTSYLSYALDGILAVLLSTPCTAPFLGSAIGFALTQPYYVTFIVFNCIGLGLSAPFALLAICPKLSRLLPRPGPWMTEFKHFMGFLLLATSTWLLFVLASLVKENSLWLVVLCLFSTFVIWIGKISSRSKSRVVRTMSALLLFFITMILLAKTLLLITTPLEQRGDTTSDRGDIWRNYNESSFEALKTSGMTIFLDFTADWCLTCKYNEKFVLQDSKLTESFKRCGVVPVRVDWTNGNSSITKLLKSYAGTGVPHYVIIKPNGRWETLPTILTESIVETAACANN